MKKYFKKLTLQASPVKREPTYALIFLQTSTAKAKGGKTVYIRPEHHAHIMRVINTIGENKLSLTDYLDNVLKKHFKDYENDINSSFRENFKSII